MGMAAKDIKPHQSSVTMVEHIRKSERERCARIADAVAALQTDDAAMMSFGRDIAAEIRALNSQE